MTDQDQNPPSSNDQTVLDQIALAAFVDDLIKAKGNIPAAEVVATKEVLLGEVNEAINTHLVNLLPEKEQVELDKLLDSDPSDEQLNVFFVKNIPNLSVEIAAALLNFRAAYLYPVSAQIAKAVENIAPAHSEPTVEEHEELMPAPVATMTPDNTQNLDLSIPQAPTAPLSPTDPLAQKKWN